MTLAALRILLKFAQPYRKALPILVLLGIVASLAEGIGIGLLIPILGSMLTAETSAAAGPFAKAMDAVGSLAQGERRVLVLSLLVVALVGVKTIVLVVNARLAASINGSVVRDLRVQLCRHILLMNYGAFRMKDDGWLMNLLDVQTHRTSEALMHGVSMLTAACFLAIFTILLLLISWQLTAMVVVVALPVSMFVRSRTRRAQAIADELLAHSSSLTGRVMELLGAMRTIRIFGQENAEISKISRAANRVRDAFIKGETVTWTLLPMVEMLYVPLFLGVLGYAWHIGIGVPSLLVFLALLYRMQPQLSRIDFARVSLASYGPGLQELAGLLQSASGALSSGHLPLKRVQKDIEFARVWFAYPEADLPALRDISFVIPQGSVFAIVGRSGSGKSTLLNLLLRLYDPTEGEVRIDGVDAREYELSSLRAAMAFSGQDSDLLAGTIRENIAYGALSASPDEIVQAARAAQADEFVRQMPGGYDAAITQRGLNLSGGQRQRVAMARALARRPSVLVLDEATNAVDNLTGSAIQETIEKLAGRCTIVIVAHRLNTVRIADQVIVMADGQIVERGTPGEVIGAGGEFARMYDLR